MKKVTILWLLLCIYVLITEIIMPDERWERINIIPISHQYAGNAKLQTSCIKEKIQIQIKQDRLHFQWFKSCISNSKGESLMQNESIDMEQLVSAHVIPVKMDVEQGSNNYSFRTPPLSPIPHFSQ